MGTQRSLLLLGMPLFAGIALLAALIAFRTPTPPEAKPPAPKRTGSRPVEADPYTLPTSPIRRTANVPAAAPAEAMIRAANEALFRDTYQNYRTAVATGNGALQGALEKSLRRDRPLAVRLAQEELANSRTELDREIAARTLEALRR